MRRVFIGATSLLTAAAVVMTCLPEAHATSLAEAKAQREALESKKAQLASKINVLRASDSQLERGYKTLLAQVARQRAITQEAQRAADAADEKLKRTTEKLQATQAEMAKLRQAIVTRAVDSYVNSSDGEGVTELLNVNDINDFTRKTAVLDEVTTNFANINDQLRAVKQQQVVLANEQIKAAKSANKRKKEVEKAMAKLQAAFDAKDRVRRDLKRRISALQHEVDEAAASQARLDSIINTPPVANVPPLSGSGLMWPLSGPVTSGFGYRWGRLHAGIDIGCSIGTPIHAAQSGTVIFAGVMNGYGNVMVIRHQGSLSTLYAHQSRLGASVGQNVSRGQIIGYSGNTGHSTGPHLHFETRVNGTPVNPMNYL